MELTDASMSIPTVVSPGANDAWTVLLLPRTISDKAMLAADWWLGLTLRVEESPGEGLLIPPGAE